MNWLRAHKAIFVTLAIFAAGGIFGGGQLKQAVADNEKAIVKSQTTAATHQIQNDQKFDAINALMRSQAKLNGQADARWESILLQLQALNKAAREK